MASFADFLGLRAELCRCDWAPADFSASKSIDGGVIALGFGTLLQFAGLPWFDRILANASFSLIYGMPKDDTESLEMKRLSREAFTGVVGLPEGTCRFEIHSDGSGRPDVTSKVTAGLAYGAHGVLAKGPEFEAAQVHITADGRPYFASLATESGRLFLLAENSLVDIDTSLTPQTETRVWSPQLFALSFFLRRAFGALCWTAPTIGANFIVDDPYLKKRYGFVQYDELIADLRRTGIALTVAFIPFNFWRSSRQTVEYLKRNQDLFSISVHGCDHTSGEYSSRDELWLEGTTAEALDRMERHKRSTGMPFDKVMVFPQGRFSTAAITALRRSGFLAAVNSTVWPEDWESSPATLRDLLCISVTRFEKFAIFARRYPTSVFDLAFDACLQKPLFGVEHHEYFRDGFRSLETLGVDLKRIVPNLKWMTLGEAVASSFVVRRNSGGNLVIRHFVSEMRYSNPESDSVVVTMEKPEIEGSVHSVIVNGKTVPFDFRAGFLCYSASVAARGTIEARVIYHQSLIRGRKTGTKYRAKVVWRRFLSDLRDNYLARSKWLLRAAQWLKDLL